MLWDALFWSKCSSWLLQYKKKKSGFSIFVNFDKLTSIQKHGKVGRYETCVLYDGHVSAHLESHVSHGSKSLRWIVEL